MVEWHICNQCKRRLDKFPDTVRARLVLDPLRSRLELEVGFLSTPWTSPICIPGVFERPRYVARILEVSVCIVSMKGIFSEHKRHVMVVNVL